MGVKNLWDILESCKQTLPLHHLQNKRLCVDLSCWLIQLQNASKSRASPREKVYLRSLFHRVRALIALNCSLIFVTDGSIPSIKLSTYRRRLGSVSEVTQEDTNLRHVASLRRNTGSEFSCMIKEAKVLGLALGIPCLDGLQYLKKETGKKLQEEAEAQCALLNSANLCDGCFSSDSDIFLFGARTVYREIVLGEPGYVICYEMADIESKLGFGRSSLIALALLLGSDYSQGVHGFGPETACRVVKSIGDDSVLPKAVSEGLTLRGKHKGIKKTVKDPICDENKENDLCYKQCISEKGQQNSRSSDQFLQVIDAYLKPKCHSPDSEAVQRVCSQHPFVRTRLQEICTQFFGWNPDKTDEYILPKIAERNLRRFSNLRTVSSELGVKISLDKMSVPCPVSAIVKQRKVQGRDYFKVSWREMEGLLTCSVPADLMESACPEKIAEFMEKKCEAKKKQCRKPRPRKSTKGDTSEIDLHLQGLMLSIESHSSVPDTTKLHDSTGPVHNIRSDIIIDLSSPSPPISACKVSKCRENADRVADIIDICDSESETSPEHERKARELRLFLDSIRRELY